MTTGIRKAAFQATQPAPAKPSTSNPAPRLEAMYRRIWLASMRDLPFINLALSVEALGFRRWQAAGNSWPDGGARPASDASPQSADTWERSSDGLLGDWVGGVITPWFVNLFVVPGGGDLWSDRPAGERCRIVFPIGPLEFIADCDPSAEVPAYQYCPLFAPPGQFASQAAARAGAMAALDAMFGIPAPAVQGSAPLPAASQLSVPARRSFLRRVARR